MNVGIRLSELVRDLAVTVSTVAEADGDPDVLGVSCDSREIQPGDLFVAISGANFDGRKFAQRAIAQGAVAVLAEGSPPGSRGLEVPWLEIDDPRSALGPLTAKATRHPDRELALVGVTGTNGKSTVVALVESMLLAAGKPTGAIGTLGYRFAGEQDGFGRTTPEASVFFRLLRRWRDRGAEAVVMEVSSHALELHRVDGAQFDVGVFTNLSRDHLDMHGDLESYFQAKRKLFDRLKPGGRTVVSIDDEWGRRLLFETVAQAEMAEQAETGSSDNPSARPISYALDRPEADVRPLDARADPLLDTEGIRGTVVTPRGPLRIESTLRGRFNLANLLAAVAVGEALELPHQAVTEGLRRLDPLPGRLEPIGAADEVPVFMDYAHTPAALEAALTSLAEFSDRRIILVFGAGGDRDRGKRPMMGRVAGELSYLPIVTTDNPRGEDPQDIVAAVEEGLRASGNDRYRLVPDRREAIRRAISVADSNSLVLVAGKGHETYQEVSGRRKPFSDRDEIHRALEERLGSAKG